MSLSDYRFFIYSPTRTRRASLESVRYCNFTKVVNAPGVLEMAIPLGDSYTPAGDDIIDVNPGYGASDTIYLGKFAAETRRVVDGIGESRILRFPGVLSVLQGLINAYTTGYADRSSFASTATHTIIENLLNYNLENGTTANGRLRDSEFTDYKRSIVAPTSSTTPSEYKCAYRNLFDVIRELCELGGHEIEAIWNINIAFKLWGDGMGSDQNLSLVTGDHLIPDDTVIQNHEFRSVAFAAGQGEEAARTVEARTGDDYSAGVDGFEMFVDYPNAANSTALQEKADAALAAELTDDDPRYRVVVSPAVRPDDNLKLGDTIKIDDTDHRVMGMEYNLNEAEIIHIRVREV